MRDPGEDPTVKRAMRKTQNNIILGKTERKMDLVSSGTGDSVILKNVVSLTMLKFVGSRTSADSKKTVDTLM